MITKNYLPTFTKAISLSLSKIVIVFFIDIYIRLSVGLSTQDVYNIKNSKENWGEKVYHIIILRFFLSTAGNLLFSIVLYFLFQKLTLIKKATRIILCIAIFLVNYLLFRFLLRHVADWILLPKALR